MRNSRTCSKCRIILGQGDLQTTNNNEKSLTCECSIHTHRVKKWIKRSFIFHFVSSFFLEFLRGSLFLSFFFGNLKKEKKHREQAGWKRAFCKTTGRFQIRDFWATPTCSGGPGVNLWLVSVLHCLPCPFTKEWQRTLYLMPDNLCPILVFILLVILIVTFCYIWMCYLSYLDFRKKITYFIIKWGNLNTCFINCKEQYRCMMWQMEGKGWAQKIIFLLCPLASREIKMRTGLPRKKKDWKGKYRVREKWLQTEVVTWVTLFM